MRLAIFDLDHTLLMADSDFLWGQFLCQQGVVDAEAYARSMARRPGAPLAEIPLTLTPEGLAQAATRIATLAVQDVNP